MSFIIPPMAIFVFVLSVFLCAVSAFISHALSKDDAKHSRMKKFFVKAMKQLGALGSVLSLLITFSTSIFAMEVFIPSDVTVVLAERTESGEYVVEIVKPWFYDIGWHFKGDGDVWYQYDSAITLPEPAEIEVRYIPSFGTGNSEPIPLTVDDSIITDISLEAAPAEIPSTSPAGTPHADEPADDTPESHEEEPTSDEPASRSSRTVTTNTPPAQTERGSGSAPASTSSSPETPEKDEVADNVLPPENIEGEAQEPVAEVPSKPVAEPVEPKAPVWEGPPLDIWTPDGSYVEIIFDDMVALEKTSYRYASREEILQTTMSEEEELEGWRLVDTETIISYSAMSEWSAESPEIKEGREIFTLEVDDEPVEHIYLGRYYSPTHNLFYFKPKDSTYEFQGGWFEVQDVEFLGEVYRGGRTDCYSIAGYSDSYYFFEVSNSSVKGGTTKWFSPGSHLEYQYYDTYVETVYHFERSEFTDWEEMDVWFDTPLEENDLLMLIETKTEYMYATKADLIE